MKTGKKLYKRDNNGNIREWYMEYDHEKYRTHSGVLNGKTVTSGWKFAEAKNVDKKNATTVEEQVELEVSYQYEKQVNQGKYHDNINTVDKGAGFFEPMLAHKYDKKKHRFPFYSQPKLDGIRCVVTLDSMTSRNGKAFVSSPHILESLEPVFAEYPDIVIDGELYNHDLKKDFEKIVSLARKTKPTTADILECKNLIEFHVYDVYIPDMTYSQRMEFINMNIKDRSPTIKVVSSAIVNNEEEQLKLFSEYIEQGYEGQMLRDPESFYENKRSNGLLKFKEFEDAEYVIVDILEGVGNWAGMAKSVEIRLEDGTTQHSGMKGNFEFNRWVLENREHLIGTQATVKSQGRTVDGKLRFPVVTYFWQGNRDV